MSGIDARDINILERVAVDKTVVKRVLWFLTGGPPATDSNLYTEADES